MSAEKGSTLKRPVYDMPEFIASALREHNLVDAYDARPPYQRNDYVGWITRAKLEATRTKRLNQMLSELKGGKLYMNMQYRPKLSRE
jgi:uncharacterized protein YdeI (YjbR/CyaY-like superfamily)